MKKFLKRACLIILLLIIAYIIYLQTLYDYNFYSSLIEIPIPIFAKIEEKDTHGGFIGHINERNNQLVTNCYQMK